MSLANVSAALLRRLDPEQAHQLAIKGLALAPLPAPPADDPILRTQLAGLDLPNPCLLYTSPSPRDATLSRMPSSA